MTKIGEMSLNNTNYLLGNGDVLQASTAYSGAVFAKNTNGTYPSGITAGTVHDTASVIATSTKPNIEVSPGTKVLITYTENKADSQHTISAGGKVDFTVAANNKAYISIIQ